MRINYLIPEREALMSRDHYARNKVSVMAGQVGQGNPAYDVRRLADEINWDYVVIERTERNEEISKIGRRSSTTLGVAALKVIRQQLT